jgi:hypothetical protein
VSVLDYPDIDIYIAVLRDDTGVIRLVAVQKETIDRYQSCFFGDEEIGSRSISLRVRPADSLGHSNGECKHEKRQTSNIEFHTTPEFLVDREMPE